MLPETASPSSFDLWERCTSWPTGWPPPSAARALERLASAEEDPPEFGIHRQRVVDDGDRTWLGTLPLIADLQRMVLDNWRNAGLIEVDITEVNEWINQQGANLSDEEQAAFQQLLKGAERVHRHGSGLQHCSPGCQPGS